METKDWLTLFLSGAAFAVAFASFYFSHVHKASGATLVLLDRLYSPKLLTKTDDEDADGNAIWVTQSEQMRLLRYSLSNTGKQSLYVKNIELLQGGDARGHLKSNLSFIIIPSEHTEAFLISPGEIIIITIDSPTLRSFPLDFEHDKYSYELVSLEVVSADGSRYQICHNISGLGSHGPSIHDPIWDGVTLGSAIRGSGFV